MPTKLKSKEETKVKSKNDYIEIAEARMNGTQEKAGITMTHYKETWRSFLKFVAKKDTFDSTDVDRYMAHRRKNGISPRTLGTEFFQLKALYLCNGLDWPFLKYDVPRSKEEAKKPTMQPQDLKLLILAQDKYTNAEKFYLAICSIFAARREAMARINKRDYDDQTILIRAVHGGRSVKHAIPPEIAPILKNCWPGEHQARALNVLFKSICRKAGVNLDKGYSWHSVRRCVTSVMDRLLPLAHVDASLWADFTGWAKTSKGATFRNSTMMGHYSHEEVLNDAFMQELTALPSESPKDDPFWMDHSIYKAHPYLKVWEEALKAKPKEKPAVKSAKSISK